jgi:hypothetical protein
MLFIYYGGYTNFLFSWISINYEVEYLLINGAFL